MMSFNRHPPRPIQLALIMMVSTLFGCDTGGGTDPSAPRQQPDPTVVDFPIAYIERLIPRDEDGNIIADDALEPAAFKPGARILLKDRASVPAPVKILTDAVFDADLTDEVTPLYDVKDLAVSYDATRIAFAMRAPEIEGADEADQPKWNIWEYNIETDMLRRVIESDLVAEAGHDIDPNYLADNRIIFSSTRQRRSRAILLDENKPQFAPLTEDRQQEAFVLHSMKDDGTDIQQLTYNQSHDLAPTILADGTVVFLRWNNYVGGSDAVSLFRMNGDGTQVTPYYGYHTDGTGTDGSDAIFIDAIEDASGKLLALLRQSESVSQGGDLVRIDAQEFTDLNQTVHNGTASGSGQIRLTKGRVATNDTVSPQGIYSSVYPLFDGSGGLLTSWSACLARGIKLGIYVNNDGVLVNSLENRVDRDGLLIAEGAAGITPEADEIGVFPCGTLRSFETITTPPPLYGIWNFNVLEQVQTPIALATEDRMYTEAVAMEARTPPRFVEPPLPNDDTLALIDASVGVVHIRNIYDLNGTDTSPSGVAALADPLQTPADQRPARFLRLVKAVSIPDDDVYDFDNSAFGRSGGQMKDILGYVPIEPDGSAKFIVPADVAFTFSILDRNGKRMIGALGNRHRNWMSVRAGERRECGGCHERGSSFPHGRPSAEAPVFYGGAVGAVPFANTKLIDALGTPHPPPENGETMAEYYASVNGPREPTIDIAYEDEWTDDSITAKSPSIALSYTSLPAGASAPTAASCVTSWTSLCRIVINYVEHIQPLWDADRRTLDAAGTVIADKTCVSCHNVVDSAGTAQVPAGQLELLGEQSPDRAEYLISYDELFFPDVPQEINADGLLADEMQQARDADGNLVFVVDEMGMQTLDADGNPIPVLEPVPANGAFLSPAGARNNPRFFNLFLAGASHDGFLNASELKLISEWLDIGGQYYNNPFAAPAN